MDTEINSLNFVTEWQDGPSQTLQRIKSLNSVTEQQDGPSQARRPVTVCVIPDWVGFLLSNLRGILDYSGFNYKVSGLMLISLITWGLKEVALS